MAPQALNLTSMLVWVDWWNTGWLESSSSIQMNVTHFIWLLQISLVIGENRPLLITEILRRIHWSFTLSLCFSLWAKHCGYPSSVSRTEYYLWRCVWLKLFASPFCLTHWVLQMAWMTVLLLIAINPPCNAECRALILWLSLRRPYCL